jgi:HlyD family secretion protein
MCHASRDTSGLQLFWLREIRFKSTLKGRLQALIHFVEAPNKRPPSPTTVRGGLGTLGFLTLFLASCPESSTDRSQGYIEGEFVYVASPLAGQLDKLAVERGAQVHKGDLLFALDSVAERAARDESERRLTQAKANLEDARKGKRPSEIQSMDAQLGQAKAALELSMQELARQEKLAKTGATAATDLDKARSTNDQNMNRVAQLEADIKTAKLGSRDDLVAAAAAEVHARDAALAKAEWDLSQKRQDAPQDALVFDTLYREGEWVAAGKPVVVLLPPPNVKVRAFVPQAKSSTIHPGDKVRVFVDGVSTPFEGKVTYISPEAEYTPPVIYSRESREKLVFMIEARFDDATAAKLHPGQPVDVEFGK